MIKEVINAVNRDDLDMLLYECLKHSYMDDGRIIEIIKMMYEEGWSLTDSTIHLFVYFERERLLSYLKAFVSDFKSLELGFFCRLQAAVGKGKRHRFKHYI